MKKHPLKQLLALCLAVLMTAAFLPAQLQAKANEPQEIVFSQHPTGLIYDRSSDTRYRKSGAGISAYANALLPEQYDLRALGRSTPVKNQGYWGTCWSFGTVASMESYLMTRYPQLGTVDLSELYIAWLAYQLENGEGLQQIADEGYYEAFPLNQGGNPMGFSALGARWDGILDESQLPYFDTAAGRKTTITTDDIDRSDNKRMLPDFLNAWTVSESTKELPQSYRWTNTYVLPSATIIEEQEEGDPLISYDLTAIAQVKEYMMENGAVCLDYAADQSRQDENLQGDYMNYNTYAQYCYKPEVIDHVVTVVGWDDDYAVTNFNSGHQPPAPGAWIIKNSWGDGWGNDGYFYLSYYDCTISAFYGVQAEPTEEIPELEQQNLYQWDEFGQLNLSHLGWFTEPGMVINVFQAEEYETLQAVEAVLQSGCTQATVQVFLLGDSPMTPEETTEALQQALASEPASEIILEDGLAGTRTIPLNDPVQLRPGSCFAILVEQKMKYGSEVAWAISTSVSMTNTYGVAASGEFLSKDGPYRDVVTILPGQSYLLEEGDSLTDLTDFNALLAEGDATFRVGNACIKAVTVDREKEPTPITSVTAGTLDFIGDTGADLPEDENELLLALANSVSIPAAESRKITEALTEMLENDTALQQEAAALLCDTLGEVDQAALVAFPSLFAIIDGYDQSKGTLEMHISLSYDLLATTDPNAMVDDNTVAVRTGIEIPLSEPLTVSFALPDNAFLQGDTLSAVLLDTDNRQTSLEANRTDNVLTLLLPKAGTVLFAATTEKAEEDTGKVPPVNPPATDTENPDTGAKEDVLFPLTALCLCPAALLLLCCKRRRKTT